MVRFSAEAGVEYRKYDIRWDFKQFYNPQPYGEKYSSKPTYASVFLQDKMEYDYFVVNLGLRYDYHNADISYNITPDATDEPAEALALQVRSGVPEKTRWVVAVAEVRRAGRRKIRA